MKTIKTPTEKALEAFQKNRTIFFIPYCGIDIAGFYNKDTFEVESYEQITRPIEVPNADFYAKWGHGEKGIGYYEY